MKVKKISAKDRNRFYFQLTQNLQLGRISEEFYQKRLLFHIERSTKSWWKHSHLKLIQMHPFIVMFYLVSTFQYYIENLSFNDFLEDNNTKVLFDTLIALDMIGAGNLADRIFKEIFASDDISPFFDSEIAIMYDQMKEVIQKSKIQFMLLNSGLFYHDATKNLEKDIFFNKNIFVDPMFRDFTRK